MVLRVWDVDALLEDMPWEVFQRWRDFADYRPFTTQDYDHRLALIAFMQGGKGARLEQFRMCTEPPSGDEQADAERLAEKINATLGRIAKQRNGNNCRTRR